MRVEIQVTPTNRSGLTAYDLKEILIKLPESLGWWVAGGVDGTLLAIGYSTPAETDKKATEMSQALEGAMRVVVRRAGAPVTLVMISANNIHETYIIGDPNQAEFFMGPLEFPVCPDCGGRHQDTKPLKKLLEVLGGGQDQPPLPPITEPSGHRQDN